MQDIVHALAEILIRSCFHQDRVFSIILGVERVRRSGDRIQAYETNDPMELSALNLVHLIMTPEEINPGPVTRPEWRLKLHEELIC